jgi:MFS family permease
MTEPAPMSTVRVVAAIVALALGGFAIGTTEFVTMGVLPDIAEGVGVDIPSAGHVISAYALGVVVGAPVIAALSARLPRRALLVGLMGAFLIGNGRGTGPCCSPASSAGCRTVRTSVSPRWWPPHWSLPVCGVGP